MYKKQQLSSDKNEQNKENDDESNHSFTEQDTDDDDDDTFIKETDADKQISRRITKRRRIFSDEELSESTENTAPADEQ